MRQDKNRFRHESLQDCNSIQEILKSITTGIGKGKVTFGDKDDEIIMEPKDLLNLKLTASQDENRHRINIRITWQVEDKTVKKRKDLSVSSD